MASNSTTMILPATSLYCAINTGLANLTKITAVHCGLRYGKIRVNSIHPGPHLTEMFNNPEVQSTPEIKELLKAIPMARIGLPEEFDMLMVFTAHDDSS